MLHSVLYGLVIIGATMCVGLITYSQQELFAIQKTLSKEQLRLTCDVYKCLKDHGITKSHRAYRAGRIRKSQFKSNTAIGKSPSNNPVCHGPLVNLALWNARSIKPSNKITAVTDHIISHKVDILAISETWLKGDNDDNPTLNELLTTLPDFVFLQQPRMGKCGGGIGVLAKKNLWPKKQCRD